MGMTSVTLTKELCFAELADMGLGSHVIPNPRFPDGLGPLGCHKAKVSHAPRLLNAFVMKREMLSLLHNLKILWAVVVLNAIYVMNNFALLYRTPNSKRRHKNMLPNVSTLVSVGVIRRFDKHIAIGCLVLAAIKTRIGFATP